MGTEAVMTEAERNKQRYQWHLEQAVEHIRKAGNYVSATTDEFKAIVYALHIVEDMQKAKP